VPVCHHIVGEAQGQPFQPPEARERATAYEFSVSMVISKVIAAILMLLFRRRDSAA
jgi:hypothetical protein